MESYSHLVTASIRPRVDADAWAISQLYAHSVPEPVQTADGWPGLQGEGAPPLHSWLAEHGLCFVMVKGIAVIGALQLAGGSHGSWLQWWMDSAQPEPEIVQQLLCFGLSYIRNNRWPTPVYLAVADYQGGLSSLLADYGFAPFSDRVKMVKYVVQYVRESAAAPLAVLEPTSEIVPTSFAPPEQAPRAHTVRIRNPL